MNIATPISNEFIQTTDRFVTYVSTVPANLRQTVGLHLREKAAPAIAASAKPHVVLFVHGGFSPSNVAYDLESVASRRRRYACSVNSTTTTRVSKLGAG